MSDVSSVEEALDSEELTVADVRAPGITTTSASGLYPRLELSSLSSLDAGNTTLLAPSDLPQPIPSPQAKMSSPEPASPATPVPPPPPASSPTASTASPLTASTASPPSPTIKPTVPPRPAELPRQPPTAAVGGGGVAAPPTPAGDATPLATPQQQQLLSTARSVHAASPPPIPPARHRKRKVTELKCSEVRWFYRRKEIDIKWIAFKGLDSLRLEVQWRKDNNVALDPQVEQQLSDDRSLRVSQGRVVVLDGLYKMSADASQIDAVYWKEDSAELRRGTWFLPDWQPINPELAHRIEEHHLSNFRGHTIPEGTSMFSEKEASKKPQLTELQLPDNYEVKWSSVIDVFLYSTTKASRILRYIAWGKGTSLRRGFEREAEWSDGSPAITHLILVVHGIGQKGYENLIAKNTDQIREAMTAMMEKHYPEEASRPMILPIEWRAGLVLDNGVTDQVTLPKMSSMRNVLNSTAMDIMYYQSPLYRKEIISGVVSSLNRVYTLFIENNPGWNGPVSLYAHSLGSVISYDILTNWSPLLLYDHYVANAIKEQCEQCRDDTTKSTLQEFQTARDKLQNTVENGMKGLLVSKDEQLLFKVKYLFAVGSPLAVFLVMRGAHAESILPKEAQVERIFNIFHPYDPVAYRLEPLFAPEYRNIRPIKLFSSHDLRSRNDYDELPMEVPKSYLKKLKNQTNKKKGKEEDGSKKSDEQVDDEEDEVDSDDDTDNVRSACSSPRSLTPPPPVEEKAKKGWWSFSSSSAPAKKPAEKGDHAVEVAKEAEAIPEEKPLTEAERVLLDVDEERRPPKRIDYQVQPALTDKSYWSVLKSHFSYWTNTDIAVFLVNVLYDTHEKAEVACEVPPPSATPTLPASNL